MQLIRAEERVTYKKAARDLATTAEQLVAGDEAGDLQQLFDRVASLVGTAVTYDSDLELDIAVDCMLKTFSAAAG